MNQKTSARTAFSQIVHVTVVLVLVLPLCEARRWRFCAQRWWIQAAGLAAI